MEKPHKKLWRKIGLEKNFLEGTSHSDQSKNTFTQEENSQFKTQSEPSHGNSSRQKLTIKQCDQKSQSYAQKAKIKPKQQLQSQIYSLQSPFDKLNFQSFEERQMVWTKQIELVEPMRQTTNVSTGCNPGTQNRYCYQSLNVKYLEDVSMKNSFFLNQNSEAKSIELSLNDIHYFKDMSYLKDSSAVQQILDFKEDNLMKNSFEEMKIRLNNLQSKKKKQPNIPYSRPVQKINKMHNTNNDVDCIQCEQMFTISSQQLLKYQRLDTKFQKLQMQILPKFKGQVKKMIQCSKYHKQQIQSQILSFKRSFQSIILAQVNQQFTQYTDEIGYLYGQNEQLMQKIQQKDLIVKKIAQQAKFLQTKLSQAHNKETIESSEKSKQAFVNQQNQINRLYQKMQDFQEIQANNQTLKKRVKELQTQLLKIKVLQIQNERLLGTQIQLNKIIKRQQQQLQRRLEKITQVEGEMNIFLIKAEQKEYQIKKKFEEEIARQSAEYMHKINRQKTSFESQKLKIKQLQGQSIAKQYELIFQELLKQINTLQVQNIVKKFNLQKNKYMEKVFEKVDNYHRQNLVKNQISSLNRTNKLYEQLEQSDKLSPKSDSNQSNSLNNNLRRTGFFGQVGKPNLTIRLDDIQTKYSTERRQGQQHPLEHRVTFDQPPRNERRQSIIERDDYSQTSDSHLVGRQNNQSRNINSAGRPRRQTQAHQYIRETPLPSTNRHRRQASQIFDTKKEANYISMNRTSNNLKTQSFQDDNNSSFTKSVNYRKGPNPYQNSNYSFSELNFNTEQQRRFSQAHQKAQSYRDIKDKTKNYNWTDRNKINDQRNDVVEKIKERLKNKFKAQQTYDNQPSYRTNFQTDKNKHSYRQAQYNKSKPSNKEDTMLTDFYEKHSQINTPLNSSHILNQRNVVIHSASRFPSNTRSRSPSNSINSRTNPTVRPGMNNFTMINKPTGSLITTNFSKSSIQRPEFIAKSRKPSNIGSYQPKSSLYSVNRGQMPISASYSKKY